MAKPTFQIITSLRWTFDGRSHPSCDESQQQQLSELDQILLPLHRDRMLAAARAFGWPRVIELLQGEYGVRLLHVKIQQHFAPNASPSDAKIYKLRISLCEVGDVSLDSSVISEDPLGSLSQRCFIPRGLMPTVDQHRSLTTLYIDTVSTTPSLFTTHKTTARSMYDEARNRTGISRRGPTEAEVLLWNEDGEIMEASLCTPYFLRGGKWTTPALSSGGNAGVTRRKALEDGLCQEATILVAELQEQEQIWLSNAVRGFFLSRLCL